MPPASHAARNFAIVVAVMAGLLGMAPQARAADPDALERQMADALRPFYAEALKRTGSSLEPGSPAWNASLAKTASAFLAARPDGCAQQAWLAATCGARSLITPSRAMMPSLQVGDTFFASPPDGARALRRGDVVAFRHPHAADAATATISVSRLIGLPGEHIRLHDGVIVIDGKRIERQPTGETLDIDGKPQARFTERLPDGRSYGILRPKTLPTDAATISVQGNMPDITVPPGRYFMLGDNRLNAMVSRFASLGEGPGMPATTDIVGRASLIYVSSDPTRIGTQP